MSIGKNLIRALQPYKEDGVWKSMKFAANKVRGIYKTHGIQGVLAKISKITSEVDLPAYYGFCIDDTVIPLDGGQQKTILSDEKLVVNWIIPEVGVGSGGHWNIFRFVSLLEEQGMHNRIYVLNPKKILTDQDLKAFLKTHFHFTNENVEVYHSTDSVRYAHATVATSWQTAYFLRRFNNTLSKFYFIQDFEPLFFPMGSEYLLAENTYRFGFRGITAGEWLKQKMCRDYHMEADSFLFSYDREIYRPSAKKDTVKRLFLYARPETPRRCFELAVLALCRLYEKSPDIEVIMAGENVENYKVPFHCIVTGNLSLPQLAELYSQCDICLVMSSTNLSLMPIEIMACNSVCACPAGANNEWMINKENAIVISDDPLEIADTLFDALNNPGYLEKLRKNGLEFARSYTTWEKEAEKVYRYITDGVRKDLAEISGEVNI